MTEMLASWKQLIEDRKQTHAWDMEKEVNRQDLDDMLAELHRRVPVKQNRVHYQISVLDYSDPELRDKYYEFCVDRDNPDHRYNPQVLAPYILIFSWRDPGAFAADFSGSPHEFQKWLSHLEIGLAANFLVHSAAARGIDTGFCKCYDTRFEHAPEIVERLGLNSVDDIYLTLGVGYGSDLQETLNPFTQKMVDAPYDEKWRVEPKPDMPEYIKFIK